MAPATPRRERTWDWSRHLVRLHEERADWAIPAAALLALVMLGVLAGAIDGADVAYGRLRIWQALASTARAAARCLVEPVATVSASGSNGGASTPWVTNPNAVACVNDTVQTVFPDSLGGAALVASQVHASIAMAGPTGSPAVTVTGQVQLILPFAFPGLAEATVQQSATATVLAVGYSPSGSGP